MTDKQVKPELLPCPFCGSKVKEVIDDNIAHAECTQCGTDWGYCGSRYEYRFDKWNLRDEDETVEEIFPGTLDALNGLSIRNT